MGEEKAPALSASTLTELELDGYLSIRNPKGKAVRPRTTGAMTSWQSTDRDALGRDAAPVARHPGVRSSERT